MNSSCDSDPATLALVDPELRQGLNLIPNIELSSAQLPSYRKLASSADDRSAMPGLVEHRLTVSTSGRDVQIIVCRPDTPETLPAVCCLHGGGLVAGSAATMAAQRRKSAIDLDAVLVFVDYALAPEHPFPEPLEDCYHALRWMFTNGASFGIDPRRVAVSGISAGGGLAAALAILARDRGEFPIIFQHLLCPMLDDRTVNEAEPHPFAGQFVWTRENNRFGWQAYLGCEPGQEGVSAYAAPSRIEDMAGLPRTFLAVGALDLFLEENLDYARRLTRSGVACELHVYPGVYHGATAFSDAQICKQWELDSHRALHQALQGRTK